MSGMTTFAERFAADFRAAMAAAGPVPMVVAENTGEGDAAHTVDAWGFKGSKMFYKVAPQALRMRFLNEQKSYQEDERVVQTARTTVGTASCRVMK